MVPLYNREGRKNQQLKAKDYKVKLSKLVSANPFSLLSFSLPALLPLLLLITVAITLSGCNAFNPQFGTLEGVVHRQIGDSIDTTPLPDVLITINGSTNTAYTDKNGHFLFSEAPSGKRTLTVIKEGYVTLKLLNVYIEPNIINQVYFGEPIILRPKDDTILYDIAHEFLEQKDYQQALSTFQELLADYPESPWADDAQYYIGFIYEKKLFKYIPAVSAYSKVIHNYPDSSWADDAQLGIGNCYYTTKDYGGAIDEYRKVIEFYPGSILHPIAQYSIAQCFLKAGKYYYEQAIEEFQLVIDLYPKSIYAPVAQYYIGIAYYQLEEFEWALAAFQDTVTNYPLATWPEENHELIVPCAYGYMGSCLEQLALKEEEMERWEEAIAIWQEAIDTYQIIIDQYPYSTCWGEPTPMGELAQERIDEIRDKHLPPEEENP